MKTAQSRMILVRDLIQEKTFKELEVNPLQPEVAFLYPLKTSENLKVF